MAEQNRTPRDLVTREKSSRFVYVPPSTTPDPAPQQGKVFRWISTHVLGQALNAHVSARMRDGWVPVKALDHPEIQIDASPTGNVEMGGLMLCSKSSEEHEAREAYYEKIAATQMVAVDNHFMRENDPRMPLFSERKSSSSRGVGFGTGTK